MCSGIRAEERLLIDALTERGAAPFVVDDRHISGPLSAWPQGLPQADVVLLRSKSHWRNVTLAHWLEAHDGTPVNTGRVLDVCGDKARTTLALQSAGVPTLDASLALAPESGVAAAEPLGYPLVVKPVVGSWGRLVGKVNDQDALELALDHKGALGGSPHTVTYLQRFVTTGAGEVGEGGSDVRSFVIGGRCVAAITRRSSGWKTNTALGATAVGRDVDDELARTSVAAAEAVGGGILAVDLFETADGYLVNEVNGTMEFRNSIESTGVDIPGLVADSVLEAA